MSLSWTIVRKAGSDEGRPGECQDAIDATVLASEKSIQVWSNSKIPTLHQTIYSQEAILSSCFAQSISKTSLVSQSLFFP